MAFPSSGGATQDNLATAWARARDAASSIKQRAVGLRASAAAGPVSSSAILDFATFLADMKLTLTRSASASGIVAYAQQQIGNNSIDIVTEFNNMAGFVDGTIAWVVANFPKDGNGFILGKQFAPDNSGRTIDRQFSSVETASFRTVLDALIATID